MTKEEVLKQIKKLFQEFGDQIEANVFFYNAYITRENVDDFIDKNRELKKKLKNFALILSTYGGDANSAYRLARFIENTYDKFYLYVFGHCKSAGTLVALGADEIIMSDFSEFGPLDVQLSKEDEMTRTSGLSYIQPLTVLTQQAFDMFEYYFITIKNKSGLTITTKTASEIASSLVTNIIGPIAAQIDPIKIGEVYRSLEVAKEYGKRLCKGDNIENILVTGYPSHEFVIDFEEAKTIFKNVRRPSDKEQLLERLTLSFIKGQSIEEFIDFLYPFLEGEDEENDTGKRSSTEVSSRKKQKNSGNSKRRKQKNVQNGSPSKESPI